MAGQRVILISVELAVVVVMLSEELAVHACTVDVVIDDDRASCGETSLPCSRQRSGAWPGPAYEFTPMHRSIRMHMANEAF